MYVAITAYKCEMCNNVYEYKEDANNCCKCVSCKNYIGRYDKKFNYVYCSCGYTCNSYASKGKKGTYSKFEQVSIKEEYK